MAEMIIEQKLDAKGKPIADTFTKTTQVVESFNIQQIEMQLSQIAKQEQMIEQRKITLLEIQAKCSELSNKAIL